MVWDELLKREIPAGWEVGILSDIAYITMGQSPDGSSYNETGVGIIFYQGSTDFGIRFPTIRVYTTSPKRFAKKGDILMSVRAPVGILNIANHDCCIGRGLAALKSKVASMVHLWFTMEVFKQRFEGKNLSGTTFGAITKDELFSLPVVVPPKELLLMFNKKTLSIFNNQLSIGAEIDKLTSLRNTLLPLLMNGQVTLNSCLSYQLKYRSVQEKNKPQAQHEHRKKAFYNSALVYYNKTICKEFSARYSHEMLCSFVYLTIQQRLTSFLPGKPYERYKRLTTRIFGMEKGEER